MGVKIDIKELPDFMDLALRKISRVNQNAFRDLGMYVDRETQLTFSRIGASGTADQTAYNRTVWKGYSPFTLHPTIMGYPIYTKWKKRFGTDGSKGRYTENSKLNQKSGLFRKTFRGLELSERNMVYGTDHPYAGNLLKKRPAINYDETMRSQFKTIWVVWQALGVRQAFS